MYNFEVPSKSFYTMAYSQMEQIARVVYGKQYDPHEGLLHAGGLHTFTVLAAPLSECAQEELDRFLAEDDYHPHPLVLLNDLARQGEVPAGSYLI